jgi:hypothetical protein
VLPLVVFFWFAGWSLYWAGTKKESFKPKKSVRPEELAFTVQMPEQEYAT